MDDSRSRTSPGGGGAACTENVGVGKKHLLLLSLLLIVTWPRLALDTLERAIKSLLGR